MSPVSVASVTDSMMNGRPVLVIVVNAVPQNRSAAPPPFGIKIKSVVQVAPEEAVAAIVVSPVVEKDVADACDRVIEHCEAPRRMQAAYVVLNICLVPAIPNALRFEFGVRPKLKLFIVPVAAP